MEPDAVSCYRRARILWSDPQRRAHKKRPRESALSRGLVSVSWAQTLAKVCLWPRHRLRDRRRGLGVIPKTRVWHRGEVVTNCVCHHDEIEFIRIRFRVNLKHRFDLVDALN